MTIKNIKNTLVSLVFAGNSAYAGLLLDNETKNLSNNTNEYCLIKEKIRNIDTYRYELCNKQKKNNNDFELSDNLFIEEKKKDIFNENLFYENNFFEQDFNNDYKLILKNDPFFDINNLKMPDITDMNYNSIFNNFYKY